MDEYDCVNKSSLKFKGDKTKTKKKKKKSSKDNDQLEAGSSSKPDERAEDAEEHGGWWRTSKPEHIRDDIAIEFLPGCYAKALGNGRIVLGAPHPPGDGPDEEEIFTAISAGSNQIAFKSGFGRYLTVDNKSRLMGLSEAIGQSESFLPVFENDKQALCAYNDCFLSVNENSDLQQIVAKETTVSTNEMLTIRVQNDPIIFSKQKGASNSDELGTIYEAELAHLRKNKTITSLDEEKKRLKKARLEGHLYEALLDSRVRHKSDKYCK